MSVVTQKDADSFSEFHDNFLNVGTSRSNNPVCAVYTITLCNSVLCLLYFKTFVTNV